MIERLLAEPAMPIDVRGGGSISRRRFVLSANKVDTGGPAKTPGLAETGGDPSCLIPLNVITQLPARSAYLWIGKEIGAAVGEMIIARGAAYYIGAGIVKCFVCALSDQLSVASSPAVLYSKL